MKTWMLLVSLVVMTFTTVSHADILNVRDFGAKGDAETDDTAAFQKALDEAGKTGTRVFVPGGRYLIAGHLNIPEAVTLEGTFIAPARTFYGHGKLEREKGTILLVTEGKGDENATPFITLNRASHLRGVIIFYPEQTFNPVPYPWTVRGIGDNCTITNVLMVNPYRAVDFGTYPAGRHYINGLYAQALKTGLFIDKCFDVGRVENVHFWPFWSDHKDLHRWTETEATAFIIGRTDWEYMTNCFAIWYAVGFHFTSFKDGPGNALLTQCGSDIGPLAVKIDQVQSHSGVSFVNSQFMARVEVSENNNGPVRFTSCGFFGVGDTDSHAHIRGNGHVTFTGCHFTWWGQNDPNAPAIIAEAGGVTVNGCDFLDEGKNHIELREDVETAVIMGNRFRNEPRITNRSEGQVAIGMNVGASGSGIVQALDQRDADKVATMWRRRLENAPVEHYPLAIRLGSAQALAGSSRHAKLRATLLKSVADAPADSHSENLIRRAKDELALDAGGVVSRPILIATRTSQPPTIDGDLDDAAWQKAKPVSFPDDSSVRSEARVLWDSQAIYLAVHVREDHMDKIRAEETRQDGKIWTDDSIEFFLCPSRISHRYLQMIVNSIGAHYDGIGTLRTTNSSLWNASPDIKTRRLDDGWTIEMRLTWKDIGHPAPKPGDVWTVDLRRWRYVTGQQQYFIWSGAPPYGDTHHPEAFGFLRFE